MKHLSGNVSLDCGTIKDVSSCSFSYENDDILVRLLGYMTSDGSDIVKTYNLYGPDLTKYISGVYLLLIYDKNQKVLYVFHSWTTSPHNLYYTINNNRFYYSTSLKKLFCLSRISRKFETFKLNDFLTNGYIVGKYTLVKNVFKLESFKYLRVEKALIQQKESKYSFRNTDLESAKIQWDEVLNNAVLRSIISDNEINMSISAGYDSNYIMYIANKESNAHINAFSVGGNVGKNEIPLVEKNVRSYNNVSLFTTYTDSKTLSNLPDIVWRLEGATYECGIFLQYELARLLHECNKTSIICGEGADQVMNVWCFDEHRTKPSGKNNLYKVSDYPYLFISNLVLKKSGILANSFGIETRYPYLDNEFISIAKELVSLNGIDKSFHISRCKSTLPSDVVENIAKIGGSTDCQSLFQSEIEKEKFISRIKRSEFYKTHHCLLRECSDRSKYSSRKYSIRYFIEIASSLFNKKQNCKRLQLRNEIALREYIGYAYLIIFQKLLLSGDYDELFEQDGIDINIIDIL